MPRRSGRKTVRAQQIPEPDRSEFVAEVGRLRSRICTLMSGLAIASPEYAALATHLDRIDDLAEALTGNRERFWTPPTSV